MSPLLSLVMDFVVLLALAGTIYYAMRLSSALNNFKSHREELKGLLIDLSTHIDQAQTSINALKNAGDAAANDLDDVLHDARRMAEELKLINETGNSLATRLENAASDAAQNMPRNNGIGESLVASQAESFEEERRDDDLPSFFIKDADFEDAEDDFVRGEVDNGQFSSRAEKELYDALQSQRKQN